MILQNNGFTKNSRDGQGLLEVVMAIGIIIIGLVGTITLILWTIAVGNVSQSQVVALNLAREGIEVARSIRDSNWLAMDSGTTGITWSTGFPTDTGQYYALPKMQISGGVWNVTWALDQTDENNIEGWGAVTNVELSGDLYHQSDSGVVTQFQRRLYLQPICDDRSIVAELSSCSPQSVIGYQVTSEVRWNEKGRDHSAKIVDRLFNWKT